MGGWTDAEKISLLLSIIDLSGGIKWSQVTPPTGRTVKACMHMVANLREQAKAIQEKQPDEKGAVNGTADSESISPPSGQTPKAVRTAEKSPTKKRKIAEKVKQEDETVA